MKKISKTILTMALIILMALPPQIVFGADTSLQPIDISVTFSNNSSIGRNINWITKGSDLTATVLKVWDKTNTVQVINGDSVMKYGYQINDQGETTEVQYVTHRVSVTGLKADTKYYYQCGDGSPENWSNVRSFVTETTKGNYSFLYMTDPQGSTADRFWAWQRTSEHAAQRFPNAKFVVLAGDMVAQGGAENQWDSFFQSGNMLASTYTLAPVIGNHDGNPSPNSFSSHFYFPQNPNPALPNYMYSFNCGDVHFMMLSTETALDDQIGWLREEVRNSKKKWNIVVLHKGPYSVGLHYNNQESTAIRSKLVPVFDELSIDAVLQGHDHVFTRAFLYQGQTAGALDAGSQAVHKGQGTLYLLNNTAGGKFHDLAAGPYFFNPLKYGQPYKPMYTGVTVSNKALTFETFMISDTGADELYDVFTIYK